MTKCNYLKLFGTDLVSPRLYIYKNSEQSWIDSLNITGTKEIMFFTFLYMVTNVCKDMSSIWLLELWTQLRNWNTEDKKKPTASSVKKLSVHRLLIVTNSFVTHSYLRSALCSHLIVSLCSLFFHNSCLHLHFISLVGRWSHCKSSLHSLVLGP